MTDVVPRGTARAVPRQPKPLWKPSRKVNWSIIIVQGAQTFDFLVKGDKSNNNNSWGRWEELFPIIISIIEGASLSAMFGMPGRPSR